MMKAFIAMLAVVLTAGAHAKAPPVKSNPRAADDAMHGLLQARDDAQIARLLSEERKFLEIGALRDPDAMVIADVLLKRGFTGVHVRALLEPRGLLLSGMETKIPLASGSKIITGWIGQGAILIFPAATLDEKVDMAIGRERYNFMQRARNFSPDQTGSEVGASLEELREMATSPEFAAYRLEVIGTRAQLFTLLRDASVRAVFVNRNSRRVKPLLAERRQLEAYAATLPPPVRMGPVAGVERIPAGPRK
jgi:hypothetical protein